MKIAVIGCGSMGCYFGAKLSKKNEVVYIDAFSKTVDALNQNGITIIENDIKENYNAPAFLSGKYQKEVDLILLFVKSTQNISALLENQDLINEHTIVMSLQNGYANDKDISRYVAKENIILGNTLINCVSEDLSTVRKSGDGLTIVGSPIGDKKIAFTGKLLLDQSGFVTDVSEDISRSVWEKLFVNITLNPLTALFNCKIKVCYENKNIWSLVESITQEAIKVAELDGYKFKLDEVLLKIQNTCFNVGKGYTSMYQDVNNKRFTEIDKLNGQIVNLAYKYKKDAPYNEFILKAIKAIEKLY